MPGPEHGSLNNAEAKLRVESLKTDVAASSSNDQVRDTGTSPQAGSGGEPGDQWKSYVPPRKEKKPPKKEFRVGDRVRHADPEGNVHHCTVVKPELNGKWKYQLREGEGEGGALYLSGEYIPEDDLRRDG